MSETEKSKELNPEKFWETVGATNALIVFCIYLLPLFAVVLWYSNNIKPSGSEQLMIMASPRIAKLLADTLIMIIVMVAWAVVSQLTIKPCKRVVRKMVIKEMIRNRLRKFRADDKETAEIAKLKSWIKEQGFTFKGEAE